MWKDELDVEVVVASVPLPVCRRISENVTIPQIDDDRPPWQTAQSSARVEDAELCLLQHEDQTCVEPKVWLRC